MALSQRLLVLAGVLFAGAVGLSASFHLIGSRVDDKGVLREPFFLLPTSALLACGGGVSLVGAVWARRREP